MSPVDIGSLRRLDDADLFRRVVGHVATGVVVITGSEAGEPLGMTVVTFTSVSLAPTLVGFLPDRKSSSWPRIARSGGFCANILGADQWDLAMRFAQRRDDKFDGIRWHPGPTGSPVLDDVVGWIDCALWDVLEAGDHLFALGEVVDVAVNDDRPPLVFFQSQARTLAEQARA